MRTEPKLTRPRFGPSDLLAIGAADTPAFDQAVNRRDHHRAYRGGDANMRSAWICTRDDVIGNLAVLLAALGVFGTGTGWPDILVAAIMATLALQGATVVIRQSIAEMGQSVAVPAE